MKGFVRIALAVCILVVSVLSVAGVSVAAATPADKLPVVKQWVNGAAQGEDGLYLHDTWAVDESGVSESKYVLVNQDSVEVFRINRYPEDMEAGKTVTSPQYKTKVQLTAPAGLSEEVLVTFENESCVYTVSLTKDNGYQGQCEVYPGEYQVSGVEVPVTADGFVYELAEKSTFTVSDDKASVTLTLKQRAAGTGDGEGTGEKPNDGRTDVLETIKMIDSDGDLLKDTVRLIIAVTVLFVVYGLIKYRRKKREELNR